MAALLTSFATVIIFAERFFEGAWSYLILVPVFYLVFSYYRRRLGAPSFVEDRLGLVISGRGHPFEGLPQRSPKEACFGTILVPLSGAASPEQVLPLVRWLAHSCQATVNGELAPRGRR